MAAQPLDPRPGGRATTTRARCGRSLEADRRRRGQGRDPLPGLDQLHDVGRRRAVPEVDTIVANAVSLHPVVPLAKAEAAAMRPACGAACTAYLDPRWGDPARRGSAPRLIVGFVRATHRECDNPVCRLVSFTYGIGCPTLWRHENLDPRRTSGSSDEFADVPADVLRADARAASRRGHLVAGRRSPGACRGPSSPQPPQTDARFAFFAGELNSCFLRREPAAHLQPGSTGHAPGRHALHVSPATATWTCSWARAPRTTSSRLIINELEITHEHPASAIERAGAGATPWSTASRSSCPVNSEDTPALMAAFPIDADARQRAASRARRCTRSAARRPRPAGRDGRRLPDHRHRHLHRVLDRDRLHPRQRPGRRAAAARLLMKRSGPASSSSTCR